MSESVANIYDALPYRGQAHAYTQPDLLAYKARLFGLKTPDVTQASMLELGCACGENIIPLAHRYPQARFVGIDYSVKQIEKAQAAARELKLTNLEFYPYSLAEVVERLGSFDYIACHGVYSWVSAENQQHILRILQQRLSPQGVAYVSYNTFPGWHFLSAIRSLLLRQVREIADPLQKVTKARAYLNFLAKSLANEDSVYGKLLNIQAENFKKFHDSYIFHEYLEDDNAPCYFGEFMEQAAAFGLQYICEAKVNAALAHLPADVRMQLQDLSRNRVEYEQQFDNVHNTTFRRTLLCHADVKLLPFASAESLEALRFSTITVPENPAVDMDSEAMTKFVATKEISFQTSKPIFKAAMLCLSEVRPRSLTFPELVAAVSQKISAFMSPGNEEADRKTLLRFLLQCHFSEMLELHVQPDPFCTTPSERPVCSMLARWQLQRGDRVSNLRHHLVNLNALENIVLAMLDGTHTLVDVEQHLLEQVRLGKVNVAKSGQPLASQAEVDRAVRELVQLTVNKFIQESLLEG
jgi:methyltransferase-like protein/cyclopropane fatty-acyl-phospholipid synthase-like methyltransferase